jgi:putative membrane protein
MGGMMGGGMGAWAVLVWLLVVALIVLAVVGIVVLVRSSERRPEATTRQRESPQDVLRRRYAAGEIDEEEFERRLAALS